MAGSEVSDFDFKTSKKDSGSAALSPQACLHLGISVSWTDRGSVCVCEGGCCGTLATCQSCVKKRLLGRLVGNTDGRRDDQN